MYKNERNNNLLYAVLYMFKERLEMLEHDLFIDTSHFYLTDQFDYLSITIKNKI